MTDLKPGEVEIHGKIYKTVALRIQEFRKQYPDYGIDTDLTSNAEEIVIKAVITNEDGRPVGTGYASEVRGSTNINKTSALENCETSAIGRALAFLGFAGTEIASADELVNALNQQKAIELIEYNSELRKHWLTICTIKQAIHDNNLSAAVEAYSELDQEERIAIWKAPSKGGIFTTIEREIMSSDEWGVEVRVQCNQPEMIIKDQ